MIWSDDAETKILDSQNKICSAMSDEEKSSCKISVDAKREIAETCQLEATDVEDLLQKHF